MSNVITRITFIFMFTDNFLNWLFLKTKINLWPFLLLFSVIMYFTFRFSFFYFFYHVLYDDKADLNKCFWPILLWCWGEVAAFNLQRIEERKLEYVLIFIYLAFVVHAEINAVNI